MGCLRDEYERDHKKRILGVLAVAGALAVIVWAVGL